MKEAVTKVIDTLTQEDFHGAFQKLLERYNKCIAAGGDKFEGNKSFMRTINKSAHTKKVWKLIEGISCQKIEKTMEHEGDWYFSLLETLKRIPKNLEKRQMKLEIHRRIKCLQHLISAEISIEYRDFGEQRVFKPI